MKSENVFYFIGSLLVIVGSFMKIMHLPNANVFLMFSLVGFCLFQGIQIAKLKKNDYTFRRRQIKKPLTSNDESFMAVIKETHPFVKTIRLLLSFLACTISPKIRL